MEPPSSLLSRVCKYEPHLTAVSDTLSRDRNYNNKRPLDLAPERTVTPDIREKDVIFE